MSGLLAGMICMLWVQRRPFILWIKKLAPEITSKVEEGNSKLSGQVPFSVTSPLWTRKWREFLDLF